MGGTTTEEHTGTVPDADPNRDLRYFPLLQTRAATALQDKFLLIRLLLSGSPAFRLLMLGSSISMLGTRISMVAFPLLILRISNSPFIAGLSTFASIVPSMLAYVPAGALVDRWNPRRVMLTSELLRGLSVASVVFALMIYGMHVNIWFLMFAMTAEEILEIFSALADRRYMSRVMERDKIDSQQASIEVRTHASVLAGRPIGPFLFSINLFFPFLADAVSFIASVVALLLVRRVDEPPREARRLRFAEIIWGVGQGFRWLKNDRRSWLTVLLMSMTSMVAQALILMFLVDAHSKQFSTFAIGVVLAASGVGGAVGSFCSKIIPTAVRSFWLPIQMYAWGAVFLTLAVTGGQSFWLSATAMSIMSFTGAIGNVEFGAYIVRNVDDDMIAKISGIGQTVTIGACALGPILGGYAIQRLHVHTTMWILFCIVALLALASLLLPGVWQWVMRIVLATKRLALGAGHPLHANSKALKRMSPCPPCAVSEGNRDDRCGVVAHIDPNSLQIENSRQQSSIYLAASTCGNFKREFLRQALSQHTRVTSSGSRKSPEDSGGIGIFRTGRLRLICEEPVGGSLGTWSDERRAAFRG